MLHQERSEIVWGVIAAVVVWLCLLVIATAVM